MILQKNKGMHSSLAAGLFWSYILTRRCLYFPTDSNKSKAAGPVPRVRPGNLHRNMTYVEFDIPSKFKAEQQACSRRGPCVNIRTAAPRKLGISEQQ